MAYTQKEYEGKNGNYIRVTNTSKGIYIESYCYDNNKVELGKKEIRKLIEQIILKI